LLAQISAKLLMLCMLRMTHHTYIHTDTYVWHLHKHTHSIILYKNNYNLGKNVFGREEEGCHDEGDQFWAAAVAAVLVVVL